MNNIFGKVRVILWDFDGVILDSMKIRSEGFSQVLSDYSQDQINRLIDYHKANGGLSRYVKFRYFFEEILQDPYDEQEIQNLASKFSECMLKSLIDEKLLIGDSLDFIKKNYSKFEMHIVSGSDQSELRNICNSLDISQYFKSINGSPTPKNELVKGLISTFDHQENEVVLIGDSINDLEAAEYNKIDFYGYNSDFLQLEVNCKYISLFSEISRSTGLS